MPMPALPQTADPQDDWKDIAVAPAQAQADDWKDVPVASATSAQPTAKPSAIVQTHPGGPVIDLANPPKSGPMDIRDIVAIGKYHKATTSPAQLAEEAKQADLAAKAKLGEALPIAGATAMSAAVTPAVGVPATAGLVALGGMGGRAAQQIYNRVTGAGPVPSTSDASATDLAKIGAIYGGTELGAKATTGATGLILKRFFPEIHEAIGQMVDALSRAAPDTAPNETGSSLGYGKNLQEAAGDLQKIAKRSFATRTGVFDPTARGGFFSSEYRPTNLWQDTNSYMTNDLYKGEIAPQIQAADQAGAQVRLANAQFPDDIDAVKRAMQKLSTIPDYDEGTHHIAARVMADPTAPISAHDAEVLGRAVNQQMRTYQRASGSTAATMASTQRLTPVFVRADELLSGALDRELTGLGQPGIRGAERRYAALADFRENLGKVLAPTERQRLGLSPTTYANSRGLGSRIYLKLGQNPGRPIEYAMQQLARADDIPMAATGAQPLPGIPRAIPPGGAGGPGGGNPGGGGPAGPTSPTGAPRLPPAPPAQLSPASTGMLPAPPSPPAAAPAGSTAHADDVAGGWMDRATRAMSLRDTLDKLGDRMPVERAKLEQELAEISEANLASERRSSAGGPPTGQAEQRAGSAIKFSTDSMGIKWAEGPGGVRVSIPASVPDDQVAAYAQKKITEQAAQQATIRSGLPKPPQ